VVSWSSRDYFGRWKALHYAAKEAFAPVLISPVLEGDTVEVWGVSDLMEPLAGTLHLELQGFDGTVHNRTAIPVTLAANHSRRLWESAVSQIVGNLDQRRVVLSVRFQVDTPSPRYLGEPEAGQERNRESDPAALLYFLPPRELELGAPIIRFEVGAAENGVLLILESDFLAKGVQMSLKEDGGDQNREAILPGTRARFAENFFDLLPNRPRTIFLETDLLPGEVAELLKIKTLAEIPKEGTQVLEEHDGQ
jgi:beta-mannosidase